MSQSPLARKSRKSLTAFARPPSKLSKSQTAGDLYAESDTFSPGRPNSPVKRSPPQNAFATPPKPRRSVATSEWDSPTPYYATPKRGLTSRRVSVLSPGTYTPPYAGVRTAERRSSYGSLATPLGTPTRDDSPMGTPLEGGERKRFVRRKNIFKRIADVPGTLYDKALMAMPTSVEDIFPPTRWASPIGMALFLLHWILLAPVVKPKDELNMWRDEIGNRVDARWHRYEDEWKQQQARKGILGTSSGILVTLLMLAIAVGNAAYLFTRHRNYDMQLRGPQDPVKSPNATPIPSPMKDRATATEEEDDTDSEDGTRRRPKIDGRVVARTAWNVTKVLARLAWRTVASIAGVEQSSPHTGTTDMIQTLRIWDPPSFCLAFFCKVPLLVPLVHLGNYVVLHHLSTNFTQLVKDRQILNAEVMREYDQRFVYKKLFAPTEDRGVGTSDY